MLGGITLNAAGELFVSEVSNRVIRKLSPVAGTTQYRAEHFAPGQMALGKPYGAIDSNGDFWVTDSVNHRVLKISAADGTESQVAGVYGSHGAVDGVGSAALFYTPSGIVARADGSVVVADRYNYALRKISEVMPTPPTHQVSPWAGVVGSSGTLDPNATLASSAHFNSPTGLALATTGAVYVADTSNHAIRKVYEAPGGVLQVDSVATGLSSPEGVVVASDGTIYVADTGSYTIKKIVAGSVTTLAGSAGSPGGIDGASASAKFSSPRSLVLSADEAFLYVADTDNHTIRRVSTSTGDVATVAGIAGVAGAADGALSSALLKHPWSLVRDQNGVLFVSEKDGALRMIKLE